MCGDAWGLEERPPLNVNIAFQATWNPDTRTLEGGGSASPSCLGVCPIAASVTIQTSPTPPPSASQPLLNTSISLGTVNVLSSGVE